MNNKDKAGELYDQAEALMQDGQDDEALELLHQAITLDEEAWASFYNIGLIYKYRQAWQKSLEYNLKAFDLKPEDEAVCWNTAIAATALEKWDIARQIWKHLDIDVGKGNGAIFANFGNTPVRLNPDDEGEVVWGSRICPVRVKINNIPFPDSGYNYQDIVLHDGAPVGERQVNGVTYSVFNVFHCFDASDYLTFDIEVDIASDDDLRALVEMCEESGCYMEDWTQSFQIICKACSEGVPHEHDDTHVEPTWQRTRSIGLAAKTEDKAVELLNAWQEKTNARYFFIED